MCSHVLHWVLRDDLLQWHNRLGLLHLRSRKFFRHHQRCQLHFMPTGVLCQLQWAERVHSVQDLLSQRLHCVTLPRWLHLGCLGLRLQRRVPWERIDMCLSFWLLLQRIVPALHQWQLIQHLHGPRHDRHKLPGDVQRGFLRFRWLFMHTLRGRHVQRGGPCDGLHELHQCVGKRYIHRGCNL